VEKYQGKWWFVDPEGKLFWSHGVNGASVSQRTQIQGREKYFSVLPPNNDFLFANISLKFEGSQNIREEATDYVFKRLRSWGINTAGFQSGRTPYTTTLRSGLNRELPEDFDVVAFKENFRKLLTNNSMLERSKNDPWCIGYFVDNECTWPVKNAKEIIYQYFKAVREVFDEFAPNKLYLGCRSNSPNFNRFAFEAGAIYCDVLSINHYDYNFTDFKETEGLDKPVIVGEFHFGALDRGMAHASLRSASSQKQRARLYQHFVNQGLESDYIVGTHWFMYSDQAYTSRTNDGENYQIGFVDVCDRPYEEMIDVLRSIGSNMYEYRLNSNQRTMANAY